MSRRGIETRIINSELAANDLRIDSRHVFATSLEAEDDEGADGTEIYDSPDQVPSDTPDAPRTVSPLKDDSLWRPLAASPREDWIVSVHKAETEAQEEEAEAIALTTNAQLQIGENPLLAERRGIVSQLIAKGDHTPSGLTAVFLETDSVSAPKAHHVPRELRYPVITLEIGGNRRAVQEVVNQIAGRAGQKSVVVSRSKDGSSVQLNTMPTREEAAKLAKLGVTMRAISEVPAFADPALRR